MVFKSKTNKFLFILITLFIVFSFSPIYINFNPLTRESVNSLIDNNSLTRESVNPLIINEAYALEPTQTQLDQTASILSSIQSIINKLKIDIQSLFNKEAKAATETIGLVRQDCTGYSNCFTSLSAWEAAYGGITFGACATGDLVCADKIATAQIDGAWTQPDTTAVIIDGWTTDATHYIRIYTTAAARHSGKWDTGKYRLEVTATGGTQVLYVSEGYARIDGLQVSLNGSLGTASGFGIRLFLGGNQISNNIIRKQATGGGWPTEGISVGRDSRIWNNIIYDWLHYGIRSFDSGTGPWSSYLYNNTVVNSQIGIQQAQTHSITAKNNISYGNADNYAGSFTVASTNNLSGPVQTDAPGSNPRNGVTVTFIDAINDDFHLASNDAGARDYGTNLSADPNLAFSDDIDGNTRPVGSAWDIGADEYTGAAPPPPSDTTPPVLSSGSPTSALPSGTTQTTLSVEATDASSPVSCKYNQTPGTAYSSMVGTLSTANGTTFTATVTGLTNGTSYNYYVRCQDAAGNANTTDYAISFSVSAPAGDTTLPTVSITSPTNRTTVSGTITISANATDNVAVAGVQFKLNTTTNLGTEDTTSPYSYSLNTTTITDGSHTLIAVARDTSNNYATSSIITITINNASPPPPDTVAPTTPTNFTATVISSSQINLSWTASTDNVGVAGYKIYRCAGSACAPTVQIATSPTNSYSNTGLTSSTAYTYAVSAYDAAGNESGKSTSASATTQATSPIPTTEVKIKELEGKNVNNYPVTISQVFKKGDITQGIAATLNGNTIDIQTNILRYYDDLSVKHALISLILPTINANQELMVDLYNQIPTIPAGNNLNITDLLSTDFDASIQFNFLGTIKTLSVRDLIQNNSYSIRYQGPIASEFILIGQPKDTNNISDPNLQIEFVIRRYKGIDGAWVSIVVDNTFTELTTLKQQSPPQSNGDITYNTAISLGKSTPRIVYQKNNVTHYFAARWRKALWWNYTPTKIQIKPDINYLISTGALPNYDTSIIPPSSSIESYYSKWLSSQRDILENGIITPYFPGTGERSDIGPYPEWAALYVFSQNPKIEEILLNTADLSGSFSIHFRKQDVSRIYSLDDDPIITLLNAAYGHHPLEKSAATPYVTDNSHQPSLAYISYLITGDKYYLDEMYYWANYVMIQHNPAYRKNELGLINSDQIRGQAWGFRQIVDAAAFAQDSDVFEKSYFDSKIKNNIQNWMQIFIGPPELNQFGWYGAISESLQCMAPDARYVTSPWMSDFLIWSLDHAIQLGYDAKIPRDWLMGFLIGRFTNGPDYDPMDGAPYRIAVMDIDQNQYTSWNQLWNKTYYSCGGHATKSQIQSNAYYKYARAVLTIAARDNLPKASEAYNFLAAQLGDTYKNMLKWAFKIPSVSLPSPPDITAPSVPTNLTATPISSSQINLSWTASTDNVGVTGYKIYRCSGTGCTPTVQIATSADNSYSNTGLTASTAYTYAVSAYDSANNESAKSSSVSATTPAVDAILPVVSVTSPTSGQTVSGTITVSADATDNVAVSGVQFKLDNANLGAEDTTSPYSISWNTTQTANGAHTLLAIARDASGNKATSSPITITINNDTTPPTISSVISTTLASTTVRIDWTTNEPSTSQVEYGFTTQYGASTTLSTTLTTSHSVLLSNLSPDNTTYNYRVRSKDSSNNESISTNNTFITSGLADTVSPASTTNLTANNITQTSVDLVTWTAAGDDGNQGTASSFDIRYATGELSETTWNNGGVVRATGEPTPKIAGSIMNYTLVGLTPNTTYKVALKTLDEVPNQSLISNIITFTTLKAETAPAPAPTPTPAPAPSSGGGGGGGGGGGSTSSGGGSSSGGGGSSTISDTTPPPQITDLKSQGADKQVRLTWENPLTSSGQANPDWVRTIIVKKADSFATSTKDGDIIYEGTDNEFTDVNLRNNQTYYYSIFTIDKASNYSDAALASAKTIAGKVSLEKIIKEPLAQTDQRAQEIITITAEAAEIIKSNIISFLAKFNFKRDKAKEDLSLKQYVKELIKGLKDLMADRQIALNHFIAYGTATTLKLGAGERAGVVNSYKSAFNKLPTTAEEWTDALKIANGRWPTERSAESENNATTAFKKIYKRSSDRKNPHDDAAITVMAYGLRPSNRNLNSEKAALKSFRAIYGYTPKSATDWDIVRAIAYSGAKR